MDGEGAGRRIEAGRAVGAALFANGAKRSGKVLRHRHPAIQNVTGLFGVVKRNRSGFTNGEFFGGVAGFKRLKKNTNNQAGGNGKRTDKCQFRAQRQVRKTHQTTSFSAYAFG